MNNLSEKKSVRPRDEQFSALVEKCYDDYCYYNQMDMDERHRFVLEHVKAIGKEELVLPYLPLYLTTRCTLNCKNCNNLMPYFDSPHPEFSLEKTKQSLLRILSVVKEITFCELVGGEPFLYADFEKILEFVASQPKIRQIVIVTNGTVVPGDSVIAKLRGSKALVRVSDYGMFEKMAQLVARLDREGVNVRIQQDMKWNDPGGIEPRNKTEEELFLQYNKCEFSLKCKYLCEDRLFTCARAASLFQLGVTDAEGDVLAIDDTLTREKLKAFYLQDTGHVCQYCDLWSKDGGKEIPAAEQVRGKIPHSRYTIISNYELQHFKDGCKAYEAMVKK
jgi:organic radical activating enzyme